MAGPWCGYSRLGKAGGQQHPIPRLGDRSHRLQGADYKEGYAAFDAGDINGRVAWHSIS